MKVITISTSGKSQVQRLIQSALSHKISIEIIGNNKRYKTHNDKTGILLDYLKEINSNELVLYIDGYDCIFLRDTDYILSEFGKMNHPFVMSTEQNFNCDFPLRKKISYYLKQRSAPKPYKFLNAGCWIGKAGYVQSILTEIGNGVEDQTMLNKYLSQNPGKIQLDHKHKIFTCTGGRAGLELKDYSVVDSKLKNNITETFPAIFHAPGKNFIGLDRIMTMLNLDFEKPVINSEIKKSYNYSRIMNSFNAIILPDNFLFHLILKTLISILIFIMLTLIII